MSKLWSMIDKLKLTPASKYRVCAFVTCLLFGAAGFCTWGILQFFAFRSIEWMIIFTAYPVCASLVFVLLYSCGHRFHRGIRR